jgi:2-dehydro-3-deoxy-D-arabinonate dehydratase
MKLAKAITGTGHYHLVCDAGQGWVEVGSLRENPGLLSEILHSADPRELVSSLVKGKTLWDPSFVTGFLAPVDHQEIWAAGVTYLRSSQARQAESEGAARFYDLVYKAPRPELFFKATPGRVAPPGGVVRFRKDSKWSVPEPELTLVISPKMKIVGATIGNDMSARDIEGENPLYLPQAKVYSGSCSIGPVIYLSKSPEELQNLEIVLEIHRDGAQAFKGTTSTAKLARKLVDLVDWLGKENDFPNGVMLMTGTGIVPPDEFTLAKGDRVKITIEGIGTLENPVE